MSLKSRPAKVTRETHESGQAQILAAVAMGGAMLTAALFSVQYAQQTQTSDIMGSKRTELRTVLDEAIKRASYLYHAESGCDPVSLNNKLARINPDGSLQGLNLGAPSTYTYTHRQINLTVSGTTYVVGYGYATALSWQTDGTVKADPSVWNTGPVVGTSQDAVIQVWTRQPGGTQRVTEMAVLINNCTDPCPPEMSSPAPPVGALTSDQCQVAADSAISFHEVSVMSSFPGTYVTPGGLAAPARLSTKCNPVMTGRLLGNLKVPFLPPPAAAPTCPVVPPAPASGTIDIDDVIALKNYLRSGDTSSGTCSNVVLACGDLNNDGLVDEMDVNVLEKVLRGYLYWLPVHY